MEQQPQESSLFQVGMDESSKVVLKSAATWGKVLGVAGIIYGGFFILIAFMAENILKNYGQYGYGNSYNENELRQGAGIARVMYIIIGAVIIIGSVFAFNFGNKISRALQTNDQLALRSGFAGVRNYFAFWSVLMLIGLLIFVLTLLAALS